MIRWTAPAAQDLIKIFYYNFLPERLRNGQLKCTVWVLAHVESPRNFGEKSPLRAAEIDPALLDGQAADFDPAQVARTESQLLG